VILTGAALDAWLDPESDPTRLAAALAGVPSAALRYAAVAKRVNSARLDEPELAAPIGPEVVGG
jgi:putative SOS response-associated peptidase YedK